jgi:hypothetical protein
MNPHRASLKLPASLNCKCSRPFTLAATRQVSLGATTIPERFALVWNQDQAPRRSERVGNQARVRPSESRYRGTSTTETRDAVTCAFPSSYLSYGQNGGLPGMVIRSRRR